MAIVRIFLLLLLLYVLEDCSAGFGHLEGWMEHQNKKPNKSVKPRNRFSGVGSVQECADRCLMISAYRCTTFALRQRGMRCITYSEEDVKSGSSGSLINARGFFTYELSLIEESNDLTECLPDNDLMGFNYRGTKTTTVNGFICQRWDSNTPHKPVYRPANASAHENYCRNPDKDSDGPWCYTTHPRHRWDRCRIPSCRDSAHKGTGEEEPLPKPECFICNGYDYTGKLNVTGTGKTCQRWDSSTPHQHTNHPSQKPDRNLEGNYCRNPDGDLKPWCYTMDRTTRWEYCEAQRCTNPDGSILMPSVTYTTECVVGTGATYRGNLTRTKSGKTCAKWSSQSPHKHTKTPEHYPCSGLDRNYCRNPTANFDDGPWCYTTDKNTRWELCDIPSCGPDGRPITTTTTTTKTTTPTVSTPPPPGACGLPEIQPSFMTQSFNIRDDAIVERDRIKRSSGAMAERILGGDNAVHGSWPWSISLRYYDVHFCGGTLIHVSWVLTASHCLDDGSQPGLLSVKVGHDRGSEAEMQMRRVLRYILHEGYTKNNVQNDIALVQLRTPFDITAYVKTACLPPPEYIVPGGSYCVVTGWGATHDPKYQKNLKQAVLPVHSYQDCLRYLGRHMQDKTQMCAGWRGQGHDTCRGDSGGPLSCLNNGHWTVQGVTSWGSGCESKQGNYGSYTRVSKYISWIKGKMARYGS